MKNRIWGLLAAVLLVSQPVLAMMDPVSMVQTTAHSVQEALVAQQDAGSGDDELYRLIDDLLLPHFDFVGMSKLVLGKNWKTADQDQRRAFVQEFRSLLVRTYAKALRDYARAEIVFQPLSEADKSNPDMVVVRTQVTIPGQQAVTIDYRMRTVKDEWKVFDVLVDNVSLVTNYRTSFNDEIQQYGLCELIRKLASKNQSGQEP